MLNYTSLGAYHLDGVMFGSNICGFDSLDAVQIQTNVLER